MSQRGLQRRVGQKIAYARWHLAWSEDLAGNAQQREALLESALWHAIGAYQAFLAEMAADEHMPPGQPLATPLDAVSLGAAYPEYLPAALAECTNLETQPGWLQDLLQWADYAQRGAAEPKPGVPSGLISLSRADMPGQVDLGRTLDELEKLIDRLRGDMLEY